MSPPYWQLEEFDIPDVKWADGWTGQLGMEETPDLYLTHLLEVFQALVRVLRPDGGIWWNMGNSAMYAKAVRHDIRAGQIPQRLADHLTWMGMNVIGSQWTKRDGLYRATKRGRPMSGGWTSPADSEAVVKRAILLDAPKDTDIVMDPFCGLGFIGTVVHQVGRPFLGIELSMDRALQARNRILGVDPAASASDSPTLPPSTATTPSG